MIIRGNVGHNFMLLWVINEEVAFCRRGICANFYGNLGLSTSLSSYAAEWSIGSGAGTRNALVPIEVRLAGDGQTLGAQLDIIFDDARLSLPVESGNIPGAGRNGGMCAKASANRVVVLLPLNTLAATAATVYCEIPFTVRNNAAAGSARLSGAGPLCFNAAAQAVTCGVQNGAIAITAPVEGGPITFVDLYQYLYVLLSGAANARTVSDLTSFGFSSGNPLPVPLIGLRVESPRKVVAALPKRAAGDFASYLRSNPDVTRAKLERYVIVQYNRSANLVAAKAALQADPFVLNVHEPLTGQFSTPPSGERSPLPHIQAVAKADPVIQDPSNTQNFNRYTYVWNNPLAYTDPSGFISVGGLVRQLAGVFIASYLPGAGFWGSAANGALANISAGFIGGYISTGNLRGGLAGAFSNGAMYAGNNREAVEGAVEADQTNDSYVSGENTETYDECRECPARQYWTPKIQDC